MLGFFAIPGTAAINFVSQTGYWFVLASFVLFLRALWLTFRDDALALRGRTIDWASLEEQWGDEEPEPFSSMTECIVNPQIACHITRTTPQAHAVIARDLALSPLFTGAI